MPRPEKRTKVGPKARNVGLALDEPDIEIDLNPVLNDGLWKGERWRQALEKGDAIQDMFDAIADGKTLREVCRERVWPYSRVSRHVFDDPELKARYEATLKLVADSLAADCKSMSDGVAGTKDPVDVQVARLRIDTHLRLAARWDRQRYGETPATTINANAGSLIAILAALPPVVAPEEHLEIDVTPDKDG